MTLLELDLSLVFLLAVILIWFSIGYQFILTVFGFINYLRSIREKRRVDSMVLDLPSCTILIPAHNEEKVISRTIDAMLRLEYPADRLQILVINDGSTDRTREIIEEYAGSDNRVELYDVPTGKGGKGKSRALNLGLTKARGDVVAIYDADNTPDSRSLQYLVAQLRISPQLGAVIGKFRTVNKETNLLTKFINIETLSFQSMLQAGRWQLHRVATLPGTNFVMWTRLIRKLDGWDEEALTEDSELSIRIYQEGYTIKYVPYAVTYEQEPQEWGVWLKQRMRWVRGNNYVIAKFFKKLPQFKNKRLAFDVLYTLSLYYIFFLAILISDVLFILGATGVVRMPLPGPYTTVWIMAFLLFIAEIALVLSYDGEDRPRNIWLTTLMYFTYCQLWIYVVIRAMYTEYIKKERRTWEKTVRFDVPSPETVHEP